MELGTAIDQVLGSQPQKVNTTASAPSLNPLLRLRKEPKAHWLLHKQRELTKIAPALRQQFRKFLEGKAPWPLFLHGPVGTGKTCAALCLLDWIEGGGHYWTLAEWCDALNEARLGFYILPWEKLPTSPFGLWRVLGRASLFVLDEVGLRDAVTPFQFETLKRAIDVREGRPLVCISNLDLKQLAKVYDDRIASRLSAGTVVCLDGADRRLSKE